MIYIFLAIIVIAICFVFYFFLTGSEAMAQTIKREQKRIDDLTDRLERLESDI